MLYYESVFNESGIKPGISFLSFIGDKNSHDIQHTKGKMLQKHTYAAFPVSYISLIHNCFSRVIQAECVIKT